MKESRLEVVRAHSEVIAPQQQWWFAQQSSVARNEVGDSSGWGGVEDAMG